MKPSFTVCLIAKNEEKTLPKLINSLKEFQSRGGEILLLDTGSTDNTVQVAKENNIEVVEVGKKFLKVFDQELSDKINKQFLIEGEELIVKEGDTLFDFASARNYIAEFAKTDMIATPDCDEAYTKLDLDIIEKKINEGVDQFEYNFVFAHDQFGNPVIKFAHCKFYNRKKLKWVGVIHEILAPIEIKQIKRETVGEDVIYLEHFQNSKQNRGHYLNGLAYDRFLNPDNDRNSHYFAREMYYTGRWKSAIKEFERHISMNKWSVEAARSMIYMGDCYMYLHQDKEGLNWYHKSFVHDSSCREPFMRLAEYYFKKQDYQRTVCYCMAALQIPNGFFYSNDQSIYTNRPHELLYISLWWLGRKEESKYHWKRALNYQPNNPKYISDGQFYGSPILSGVGEYKAPEIEGMMSLTELQWLYQTSKEMDSIVEIGSFKGKSTHALLSGCKNIVYAVDHFKGSADPIETGNADTYEDFMKNVGEFKNLRAMRIDSIEASKEFEDKSIDMVFIDGGHQYKEVVADINAWLPKVKKMICGHDYHDTKAVKKAVDEMIGKVEVCDRIWYKFVDDKLTSYTEKIKSGENFIFVKRGDGELACMAGKQGRNCDGHNYSKKLGDKLKKSFEFLKDKADIVEFADQKNYNILLHRKDNDLNKLKEFYVTIKNSDRQKVFVGPGRLKEVSSMLNAEFVEVPLVNCFDIYDEIKLESKNNDIFIFSCGMVAKCLIADLVKKNKNITCIDAGSSFDPIFVGNTRTEQEDTEKLKKLYFKKVPDEMTLKKMFSIAQESHPERLYVLEHIEKTDSVIYDLGCGKNKTIDKAIGIDIEPVSDIVCSIDNMPFVKDNSVDVIISRHSLEHTKNIMKTLVEWKRMLKSTGKIIIVLPDDEFIDTMNPVLSCGAHYHAFTRDSFRKILSIIPELYIEKIETVMNDWSFGGILRKLPSVSILIPQLGRKEGLKRCLDSIHNLNYPKNLIDTKIINGDETVPIKIKKGVEITNGEYICYAANDMEFEPNSLMIAISESMRLHKGLVSFNEGYLLPDEGNVCTHFIIRRDLLPKIGGEIFCTEMYHVGVDNLLWAKCKKIGEAFRSDMAKIKHHHFSIGQSEFDDIYKKGWEKVKKDRKLLELKLTQI